MIRDVQQNDAVCYRTIQTDLAANITVCDVTIRGDVIRHVFARATVVIFGSRYQEDMTTRG